MVSGNRSFVSLAFVLASFGVQQAFGYDASRTDNVVAYWGTNSYGATHGNDQANWQKSLAFYCQDDSIDAFPIAFVDNFFGQGGLPSINLANTCSSTSNKVFPGTGLADCSFLAPDIKACQAKGKIVTMSFGGATGAGLFSSAKAATDYADLVWNTFLGGTSSTRPFGDAVLDGIDLDIEGGSTQFYDSFVKQLRTHWSSANKKYYLTGAPQCPFPDAFLGTLLNEVAFDAIYVQFYNNFCSLPNFNSQSWNFESWDTWAKSSPNPNVKVFIGAPAAPTAAGSGYVDVGTLANIATTTRSKYSSFGGIMFWDASQAYVNNRFDAAIKKAISTGASSPAPATTPVVEPSTSVAASPSAPVPSSPGTSSPASATTPVVVPSSPVAVPPSPPGGSACSGAAAWIATTAYPGGSKVSYNGHLYVANWWSQGTTPSATAAEWTDKGACSGSTVPKGVRRSRIYKA